jgi:NADH-quinone oxidoreductase subunit H
MSDPINLVAEWLRGLLVGWGLSPGLIAFLMTLIGVLVLAVFTLLLDVFLVWVERKVVARFQDRLGPNRLGPFGLIQPFADVIKLIIKEDITPVGADKVIFNIAPLLALGSVLMLWAVIPLASTMLGSNIDVGILFIVAVGAIGTLGILMAGWASNNKYALLGALRMVAQVVSYEVPMVITLLIPVILARSMSLKDIVDSQSMWNIVLAPIAAVIFLITAIAELGRAPFDLNEAESEIVAGFHIEYTGMKFGMFYAGELLHALTMGALFSSFFLGGWRGPLAGSYPILGVIWLLAKAFFIYWVIMWVKYSLPRLRIDHMLSFNWKFLTPLSLVVLMVTAVLDKLLGKPGSALYILGMLAANLVIAFVTLQISRKYFHIRRQKLDANRPLAAPDLTKVSETHPG